MGIDLGWFVRGMLLCNWILGGNYVTKREQWPFTSANSSLLVYTWGASSVNQGVLWCHWLIIKIKLGGHVRPGTDEQSEE